MRISFVLFALLTASSVFFPAMAQESTSSTPVDKTSTRIEANPEHNEIRFYVKGELSAILKDDGFHVQKNIFYGDKITDYGEIGFRETENSIGTGPDAERDGSDAR